MLLIPPVPVWCLNAFKFSALGCVLAGLTVDERGISVRFVRMDVKHPVANAEAADEHFIELMRTALLYSIR